MKDRAYQQCTRCVMDTSDPDIIFDGNGYCNHCNEYLERTSKRMYREGQSDRDLAQVVARMKKSGKNKQYDCVLGISGGIDSCYAALVARNLGLRVLAVHMDNGWNSEAAVKNIKNVLGKLGIDYQSFVLDWEEFKDLQLSFLKASVPEAETPTDIAIPGALHKIAAKHNIKYVISGGNFATEGILPKSWHYDAKDMTYLNAIHEQFGTGKLKKFPRFGYRSEIYYKFVKGMRMVYLLNYVPFSKKDAMATLERELGWKYYGGKHYESRYTGFLQSYILPTKFNIDYRRATFSTQICAGELSRDEALDALTLPSFDPATVDVEKDYWAKKFGISTGEFNKILSLPPRSYRDYPNDQRRLEYIYSVYRRLMK